MAEFQFGSSAIFIVDDNYGKTKIILWCCNQINFRESLISAFLCRYEIYEQYTEHDKDIALLLTMKQIG